MVTYYRRLPKFDYRMPKTVKEALALLSQKGRGKVKVFAGGTDLIPKLRSREVEAPEILVDLKGIPRMDYIQYDAKKGLKIGSLTTISSIENSPIVKEKFGVLAEAAHSIASPQVRNKGTIAGNICNAVPSADSAPSLLTLEARLKLVSLKGERMVKIEDFFTGPNETVLSGREILREIQVPPLPAKSKGVYLKLSPRSAMDLAIVGVAVVVILEDGICKDIRVALGAVAPTPIRVKKAEDILRGQRVSDVLIEKVAEVASREARPIDDHRASAEYRREMVAILVRRAIKEVVRR
jgi:CO/xanthine dehydrogenase FAD-binding subunit